MVNITVKNPVALINSMISVGFSVSDGVYEFNDAIVVLQSQYDQMSEDDILSEARRRWDNWISVVVPPSNEELVDG